MDQRDRADRDQAILSHVKSAAFNVDDHISAAVVGTVEVFGGQLLPCLDRLTMFWRKTGLPLRLVAAEKPA